MQLMSVDEALELVKRNIPVTRIGWIGEESYIKLNNPEVPKTLTLPNVEKYFVQYHTAWNPTADDLTMHDWVTLYEQG